VFPEMRSSVSCKFFDHQCKKKTFCKWGNSGIVPHEGTRKIDRMLEELRDPHGHRLIRRAGAIVQEMTEALADPSVDKGCGPSKPKPMPWRAYLWSPSF